MNVVEKYGGTSVGTIAQIKAIAAHAAKLKAQGNQVVIVASAMGKTTNKLIAMAKEIGEHVNERELDSLLSTGEQRTITLLAMAIDALGVPAVSLTGYQCGFITSDHHSHARIMDIDITRLKQHLNDDKVVVVAGFQGANEVGDITTLGRGGSDTTAVALAAKLGWECHIFTDVNGVYTIDPRMYPHAKRLHKITYNEMMQMACLGAGVLETRSVELASKYGVRLYLGRALEENLDKGTYIMEKTKHLEDMPITGISIKEDYAIMRVNDLPNDGKFLNSLFVMISQQLTHDGKVNFAFYCNKQQSDVILKNIDKLHSRYPISRLLGFVKLSIVGVGISTHSGIAAKVLTTLSDHNIRYYQITSSEISISLTIEEKDKLKAVEVLGKAFDL